MQRCADEKGHNFSVQSLLSEFLIIYSDARLNASGRGTAAFQQRAKIVALCGWETKILPVSTSVHSQRWNTIASETESAGRAILSCKLCGAKVGLWAFLPRARLQAMKSGQ